MILSAISSTIPNEPSTKPKLETNHIRILDTRIIVVAFLMKAEPLSIMLLSTFVTVGT